jgi:hypothetical protein
MYEPKSRLVLEGPDLSGKSTVGIMLEAITGLELRHYGGPPKTADELLDREASYHGGNWILDRHTGISEIIYGGALRGGNLLVKAPQLFAMVVAMDPIIVHCHVDLNWVKSRFKFMTNADKDYKPQEHRRQVMEKYDQIWNRYSTVMQMLIRNQVRVINVDFRTATTDMLETQLRLMEYEYK